MKILAVMDLLDTHKKWLEEAAGDNEIVYIPAANVTIQDVSDAEVIIGNIAPALLSTASKLRWVQLFSAGASEYCKPGVLQHGVMLTNATGAYGLAISEHMLAVLLAMMKKLYVYEANQKQCLWKDEGPVTSVSGATVLVIGLGDIGGRFARLCKMMGAHVIGMRRRSTVIPDYADEMGTMERLDEYLARADVIVSSLPGTKATTGLYNKERFQAMKQGAYFINVGRGTAVVSEDLCNAVKNGHLAGAALDVTDPEPLPKNHPLWSIPGIHITPHVSGGFHLAATHDNIVKIAAANLRSYICGVPLKNEVDFMTGYKK
ncbi:D-2-hydroxyacid dehydrogenase [Megasphaera paucivorans]|uniref:Phosphoglycerate dehydrogenase n=1 Tax=Megasphaera paucivorans TaxID=349095 RepID=A0A1G9RKS7_9FIRM|nr:D-2-hydroxyacid dehydrogenase [Megasphaera paucivorans]SDM23929.1 Phosphoglycerate dehydrogenase [Megasphaera paucivorans]